MGSVQILCLLRSHFLTNWHSKFGAKTQTRKFEFLFTCPSRNTKPPFKAALKTKINLTEESRQLNCRRILLFQSLGPSEEMRALKSPIHKPQYLPLDQVCALLSQGTRLGFRPTPPPPPTLQPHYQIRPPTPILAL